ncbi:MAG: hypothetical protein HOC05_07630, partial [Gemmatimonadetes bacterium]|nr:hypothetical protein [Gemmatimonadota bacterium]
MSEDRKKVLEMLSEGKINVEEAERLLQALGEGSGADEGSKTQHVSLDDLEDQIK